MAVRRKGRGRLSTIAQLPDDAQEDVRWACEQLNAYQRDQTEILAEFNERLAARGLGPISSSAFNRFSVSRAAAAREMTEMREMFAGLADQFSADQIDESNVALGQFIKSILLRLIQRDRAHSTKETMELARAYASAVSAQRVSVERRSKIHDERRARALAAVDAAAGAVAQGGPAVDLAASVKRIREEIYGIFDAPPESAP